MIAPDHCNRTPHQRHDPAAAMKARSAKPSTPDADACWTAVLQRDAASAATFVYAVRSTGIYCRPTCPSRLPLRRNVEFHPTAQAAAAAGYRPCKRCRPDDAHDNARRHATLAHVCRLIEDAERLPSLADLARAAHMSPSHFHRTFKAALGVTPRAYAAAKRAERARHTLAGAVSVTQALHDAGYESHSTFYADSREALGMSPSAYRNGARGETLRYAVAPCRLGHVIAAATSRGICAILLGDQPSSLVAQIERAYPHADWQQPDAAFDRLLKAVVDLIDEPTRSSSTLPLDIRGTAFQQRVWQALRAVPPGTTVSYAELARRIGSPKAVRAVGSACAANVLAVAIPCHRAVRSNGDLSGYRWGLQRKRALLDEESRAAGEASSDAEHRLA